MKKDGTITEQDWVELIRLNVKTFLKEPIDIEPLEDIYEYLDQLTALLNPRPQPPKHETDLENINLKRILKVKKVTLVKNLELTLEREFPGEYDMSSEAFFKKYSGKQVEIYGSDGEYFILGDDNYVITDDCF